MDGSEEKREEGPASEVTSQRGYWARLYEQCYRQVQTPLESLRAFDGEEARGTWTLEIVDHFDLGHGDRIGWSLELQ